LLLNTDTALSWYTTSEILLSSPLLW